MQIQQVKIKDILIADRARQDYGDLSDLVESIRVKGVLQPITIDTTGRLIAGGRRIKASEAAGLDTIPAIRRKIDGEVDSLEIELFENIHRKDFNWIERAQLEKRINELKGYTLREQAEITGDSKSLVGRRLQLAEALDIIPELKECKNEDDAWKTLKKVEERLITDALVQRAKASALKGVKIAEKAYRVGDVFAGMEALNNNAYHFAEVDPPYAVDLLKRKSRHDSGTENYHEWEDKEYSGLIQRLAEETYRVLQPGSFCVWWYGMSWHTETLAILRETGFQCSDIPAIWYKGNQGQTASPDTMLGSCYEPFFACRKGDAKLAKAGRSNVFTFDPLAPQRKIHPTEKPIDLLVEILNTFTFPGQRCVVPLLGSGVTLRASYITGRIAFGWDLEEENKKRFLIKVATDEMEGLYGKEDE